MIVACLLIMGSFTLVAVNLDNMLGDLEAENEFLAYVDESYTEEQARDIKSQIEAIPNVSQVTFVTRAEAMDDFRAGRENNELLADLPDEVLRDRFRIHVQDIKQLKATSEQVQKITGVADVNAAYDIAQGFVLVRNIATGVAAVLVAITNADAAKKAENAADNLRAQMKGYLDDNARARQETENTRREMERLRREIEDLRRGGSRSNG